MANVSSTDPYRARVALQVESEIAITEPAYRGLVVAAIHNPALSADGVCPRGVAGLSPPKCASEVARARSNVAHANAVAVANQIVDGLPLERIGGTSGLNVDPARLDMKRLLAALYPQDRLTSALRDALSSRGFDLTPMGGHDGPEVRGLAIQTARDGTPTWIEFQVTASRDR